MISPIAINNKDLNKAWTNKWKKAKHNKPQEYATPIKAKWERVDKAISFFISTSNTAFIPE